MTFARLERAFSYPGDGMDNWPGLNEVAPYAWSGGAGLLGRIMFHARQVQAGRRKPISWALLWDVPIALAMGWIAFGVCRWQGLPHELTVSAAILASYLGPYTVDLIVARGADKYLGKPRAE